MKVTIQANAARSIVPEEKLPATTTHTINQPPGTEPPWGGSGNQRPRLVVGRLAASGEANPSPGEMRAGNSGGLARGTPTGRPPPPAAIGAGGDRVPSGERRATARHHHRPLPSAAGRDAPTTVITTRRQRTGPTAGGREPQRGRAGPPRLLPRERDTTRSGLGELGSGEGDAGSNPQRSSTHDHGF